MTNSSGPSPIPNAANNFTSSKSHGDLTREGIARARARGTAWGGAGKSRAAENRDSAQKFAETLRPVVSKLAADGKVFGLRGSIKGNAVAAALNELGVKSREGKAWHAASARRLVQRLEVDLRAELRAAFQAAAEANAQETKAALGLVKK